MEKFLPADYSLETERLWIRPYTQADFEDYFAYIMDAELQTLLGLRDISDRESAWKNFRWLMEERDFLALVSKADGEAIGHIALHPPYEAIAEDENFRGKTGASLSFALKASRRRQGIMLEALKVLLAYLKTDSDLDFVDCEYADFNAASERIQKKLGFHPWRTDQFEAVTLVVNLLDLKTERRGYE